MSEREETLVSSGSEKDFCVCITQIQLEWCPLQLSKFAINTSYSNAEMIMSFSEVIWTDVAWSWVHSSCEAANGNFAVGLPVGGKCFGMSHLNLVLLSFLASRDSAKCGSWYVHLMKLLQTGADMKKGAGMMWEIDSLSWEETDRIKTTVWPYESVRAQIPVRESCFSEAYSWHKIKGI